MFNLDKFIADSVTFDLPVCSSLTSRLTRKRWFDRLTINQGKKVDLS